MNYQEILQSVNFPTTAVTLDFETYFDDEYSMKKMSTVEFVTDSRFKFTGVGIFESKLPFDDPHNCVFWSADKVANRMKTLQNEYGKNLEGCTVVGQNLMFDCLMLSCHFGIIPKYTVDILNLARHEDSKRRNDLKHLCIYYETSVQKGDTQQFKGLTYRHMSPSTKKKLADYCRDDVIAETELFRLLLPKFSNPELELRVAHHTLLMYLRPLLEIDFQLAKELILAMQIELTTILNNIRIHLPLDGAADLNNVIKLIRSNKFADILQWHLPEGEQIPTKFGKKGLIPAFAKTDEAFQALLNHPKYEVRNLVRARVASKSWPTHILRVQNIVKQAKAQDGKLAIPLRYHAAHTARWGGTQGINLQNLPATGRAGSGTSPLLARIRNLLIAPEGYMLPIVDLAQIEARILAWFAGQQDLLEGFKNGEDIYSQFATILFGHTVRKKRESDSPDVAKKFAIQRGFGKDAILGCGYGMGAAKFHSRCLANADLKPAFDNGTYDFAFIEKLIRQYRTMYPLIPKFWTNIEKCFRWVTKYPTEVMSYFINSKETLVHRRFDKSKPIFKNSLFTFWNESGTVNVQLPSGRVLKYPQARIKKQDNSLMWKYGHLWGGSITENLDQAVARDILAEAILRIEDAGIPVVLHAHDEVVGCVEKQKADSALNKITKFMCTLPTWAAGLPIEAEGKIVTRYEK